MQDRLNQKWRDTMALMGREFTKHEHAAGWPDSFKPERIATLQRPFKWWPLKDREDEKRRLCIAYRDGLNAALASGKLPSIIKTELVVAHSEKRFQGFKGNQFTGALQEVFANVPVYGDKEFHYITAPAFAAWLAAQGETPSPHIQAWFDAVGVTGAAQAAPVVVSNSAPPTPTAPARQNMRRDLLTPLIEAAQRDASDPYDTPAIWEKLRAMAAEKIGPLLGVTSDGIKWIDGNDEVQFFSLKSLRDRLGRQKRATQKRVKTPLVRVK